MNHLLTLRNLILMAALCITVGASTYRLSEAPAIWYDEGYYTQMAQNLAETGRQVLQVAPGVYASTSYVTVGYPLTLPVALSYSLFGDGVVQGRAVMVLFILGFVGTSYLLTRRLFALNIAAVSCLFIATFPMLYGNGKSVLGEVPALFFLTLTLLSLSYLEKNNYKDWRLYALVGLCAGLTAATKMFFILFLAALGIVFIFKFRRLPLQWGGIGAGAVALALPLIAWVYIQFGTDASLSSIISYYSNPYAVENIFTHALQNGLRLFTESTPLYTTGMLFVWGTSFLLRKREEVSATEIVAMVFCILVLLSYLRLEGWYRYIFPATCVALIFFSNSLVIWYKFAAKKIPFLARYRWAPYLALLLLGSAQLYQTAFSSYVASYYNATRTKDVSTALAKLPAQSSVFLYNIPEVAILLPTHKYYQYLSPLPKIEIGKDQLPVLAGAGTDYVIVGADKYEKESSLFAGYIQETQADRYLILKKK